MSVHAWTERLIWMVLRLNNDGVLVCGFLLFFSLRCWGLGYAAV